MKMQKGWQHSTVFDGSDSRAKARRLFRRRKKKASDFGHQADEQLEKLFIRRLGRLQFVRRFVAGWLLLFALVALVVVLQIRGLSAYFQTLQPVSGGIYSEGLIGSFTNANPLYATSTADTTVSRLIFSSLFKYDQNNQLVGDLAESIQLDAKETRYVVTLKKNVFWHDGEGVNADDVVFTYQAIQDPDTKSSLYTSWQGIKVSKQDDYVVIFDLPNRLSSFPYALTNGIVPQHLLSYIPHIQLRSASFNTSPIGTGPFKWKFVEVQGGSATDRQQHITLAQNPSYFAGRPKLDGFVLHLFRDEKAMVKAFHDKQINAMSGLESVPDELAKENGLKTYYTPLTSAVMVFFNNSREQFKDPKVRTAMVESVDKVAIIKSVDHPAQIVDSALLHGQLAYDPNYRQAGYNMVEAGQLLDKAGWLKGADGIRAKAGKPLTIGIRSQGTKEYTTVAQYLQKQWTELGVKVDVRYFAAEDLQSLTIANHEYDALLYGISIGVDPDVFAYWHSSQAGLSSQGRINLSEYKSAVADQALEAGRTRSDPTLRTIKYRPFLEAWRNDNPALGLYQPTYLYIVRGNVFNYQHQAMNSGVDRLDNVHNWMIREEKKDII